jgi:hypothetical protein
LTSAPGASPAIACASPRSIYFRKTFTFKRFGGIHVMTAKHAEQRKTNMTTFTIDEQNNISAFSSQEEASAATTNPFDSFSSQKELAELAKAWPMERLVATFNSLTGVHARRELQEQQPLPSAASGSAFRDSATPLNPQADRPRKAERRASPAKGGQQAAKGAPVKGKATKKTTPAKKAPNGPSSRPPPRKSTAAKEPKAARTGSKSEEVIALLRAEGRRDHGRDRSADRMAETYDQRLGIWLSRCKKMGIAVESFKSDQGGERTYRLCGAPHKR